MLTLRMQLAELQSRTTVAQAAAEGEEGRLSRVREVRSALHACQAHQVQ
jgi:hypothetical protein